VQRHPHPDRPNLAPRLGLQPALGVQGGREGIGGARERGMNAVARGLHHVAVVLDDRRSDEGVMAGKGDPHRLGVLLPARGAAFDVREQEGHRPARQLGHDLDPRPVTEP
jgi:hypothetical protein